MNTVTVIPAYGRDYKTPEKARAEFTSGKDFQVADISNRYNGAYCSIRDLAGYEVKVRFNALRDFIIVKVPAKQGA